MSRRANDLPCNADSLDKALMYWGSKSGCTTRPCKPISISLPAPAMLAPVSHKPFTLARAKARK